MQSPCVHDHPSRLHHLLVLDSVLASCARHFHSQASAISREKAGYSVLVAGIPVVHMLPIIFWLMCLYFVLNVLIGTPDYLVDVIET